MEGGGGGGGVDFVDRLMIELRLGAFKGVGATGTAVLGGLPSYTAGAKAYG